MSETQEHTKNKHFLIITYMGLNFFSEYSELVHLSTLFAKKNRGYKKETKHKIKKQLLVHTSTLLNNEVHALFFRIFRALVHLSTLFPNILKGTRKKENMK